MHSCLHSFFPTRGGVGALFLTALQTMFWVSPYNWPAVSFLIATVRRIRRDSAPPKTKHGASVVLARRSPCLWLLQLSETISLWSVQQCNSKNMHSCPKSRTFQILVWRSFSTLNEPNIEEDFQRLIVLQICRIFDFVVANIAHYIKV